MSTPEYPALATALQLARLVQLGPDVTDDGPPVCRWCSSAIMVPAELEPSPLCNPCAQDIVALLSLALLGFVVSIAEQLAAERDLVADRDTLLGRIESAIGVG